MKHIHYDLIVAWAGGAKIECFIDGQWYIACKPDWAPNRQYRIKPEPKTLPFAFTDRPKLLGRSVTSKGDNKVHWLITAIGKYGVTIGMSIIPFDELLENYTFSDGATCGKIV